MLLLLLLLRLLHLGARNSWRAAFVGMPACAACSTVPVSCFWAADVFLRLPSCPAEREIKYKQEKKYWEEKQKELAARVAALGAERDALRGGSGAQQLEERIQVRSCCAGGGDGAC